MSKRSRKATDYSPSTFPFLAVLLCTIGALVLILAITVVHSRASANKAAELELGESIEEVKEQSDFLVSVSEELQARRERLKKELERRRRELSHIEDHIDRLRKDLTQLQSQSEQAHTVAAEAIVAEKENKIAELEKQLEAKKQDLEKSIEERKDQKPAFSIIPYEGPNGTARRPVYLECRADGLVIQPEGITLSLQELAPPHGPGNPLDATLRVLRTAYQAKDQVYGITTPPYPLLIVRPDGINTYALARAAMAGWDDQYGYELVEAERELAFPEGLPGLTDELQKTLIAAKQRQQALIASLPARLRRDPFDLSDQHSWDDEGAQGGAKPSADRVASNNANRGDEWGDVEEDTGRWKMLREVAGGQQVQPSVRGVSSRDFAATRPENQQKTSENGAPTGDSPRTALNPDPYFEGATGGQMGGNPQMGFSQPGLGGGTSSEEFLSAGNAGNAQGSSGAGDQGGSVAQTGPQQSSNASSSANRFSSGASSGSSGGASSLVATDPNSQQNDVQQSDAIREQNMKQSGAEAKPWESNSTRQNNSPAASGSNNQGSDQASKQGAGNGSRSSTSNRTPDSDLKPISISAGKDWATTRMDNRSTPVTRPVRIIVLDDRWLLRNEENPSKYDIEILLEQGPQVAGSQLKEALRDRVESWGPSLPGGYWAPALTAETASDAQRSLARLQRLLDSSGAILQVQPLTSPSQPKR